MAVLAGGLTMRVWCVVQQDGSVDSSNLGMDVFKTKADALLMCILERGEQVVESELSLKTGRRITRKTALRIAGQIQDKAERDRRYRE
jgi:hypothetical protein